MRKVLLFLFISLIVILNNPVSAQDNKRHLPKEKENIEISLKADNNSLRIKNAERTSILEIYNVLGVKVLSVTIESSDQNISLNLPKGCYIIKIKDIVRKIAVK